MKTLEELEARECLQAIETNLNRIARDVREALVYVAKNTTALDDSEPDALRRLMALLGNIVECRDAAFVALGNETLRQRRAATVPEPLPAGGVRVDYERGGAFAVTPTTESDAVHLTLTGPSEDENDAVFAEITAVDAGHIIRQLRAAFPELR